MPVVETLMTEAKKSLLDLRLDAGFDSQAKLAYEAGIAPSTVWLAENGRSISYRSARLIVKALNARDVAVKVSDLDWKIGRLERKAK